MIRVWAIWRWPLLIAWVGICASAGVLGCLLPLTQTLGYEFSLLISLVAALGAGHLAACYPHRIRRQEARFPGARFPVTVLFLRAMGVGSLLLALPLGLSLLNSYRVAPCNMVQGFGFYFLLPVCSVVLAVTVGLFVGLMFSTAKPAAVMWIAIFLGGIFAAFYRFYDTPAVYVFGPFFGYFPGVLYDELVSVEARLITYRMGTVLQVLALLSLMGWLIDPGALRLSVGRFVTRRRAAMAAMIFTAAALGIYAAGPKLGHRTDRSHLEALLDNKTATGSLKLFFPKSIDDELRKSLTDDARFHLAKVERYLGIAVSRPISIFFFQDVPQKAQAMGAAGTNVAKPWRSEIYVTVSEPPHPVLRHELVHAVAAEFASGPFAVPGSLFGLLPDPGLIEGLATAAQGPRTDLTLHQWAAAMKSLDLLPSLDRIFGLGFFRLPASAAYTAAGSFCDWVHTTFGQQALRLAYATGDWEASTGRELSDLENAWLAFLATISLEWKDLAIAKHRFDRPSVIHSTCVHEVARLNAEAARLTRIGATDQAFHLYEAAHARSGGSTATKMALFYTLIDMRDFDTAQDQAQALLRGNELNAVQRARVEEILADAAVNQGYLKKASATFVALIPKARNANDRRRLEVKAHLAALSKASSNRVLEVLALRPSRSNASPAIAALAIADAVIENTEDPILAYLYARQHVIHFHGNAASALEWLSKSESLGLASASDPLYLEARMLRGRSLLAAGDTESARSVFGKLAANSDLSPSAKEKAKDWQDRCVFLGSDR
ncbi:MAG: hypothetical protein QNJ97_20250 [Myxococcota bacterium]|nr:hypothetical protein [Myxococcota bacterium]